MNSRVARLLCSILTAGVFTLSAFAQSNEGSLSGTVTDPAGAVVPNATVTATNVAAGQTLTTITTSSGAYHFPQLTVGAYNVTVTAPGFKKVQQSGVVVQIQTTTALDIKLSVGSAAQTVEVSANAPQLQTESADVGTVVTPRQVLDLPLSTNGTAIRNSQDFVFLTPATYGTGTNGGTFEGGVSGGQAFGSEIIFDGASLQVESFGDGFANEILPSVEATGEFKVLVGGIPAQYGRTTGGVQSYTSKSGTNSFHGGAFEILRNTDFDANTWFNNLSIARNGRNASNVTPSDKKNEYGVLLGGPVWIPKVYDGRNKTFFFFAWEQFKQTVGYSSIITIPTQANLAGDFSQNLTTTVLGTNPCDGTPIYQGQIFDPTTTRTVNGTQCRTAYPGNIIRTPLSNVATSISKYLPASIPSAGLQNNYNFAGSLPYTSTTDTLRIDQSFGTNDKMFGSYSVRDNGRHNYRGGVLGLPLNPIMTLQDLPTHIVRIGYDHIFSPSLLNHALIGFTRVLNLEQYTSQALNKDWSSAVGLPGGSGPLFPGIIPQEGATVQFGNPEPLSNQGYNSKISDNIYSIADSVTWTKGRHNLSIGGEYRYELSISGFLSLRNGNFTFTREQTAGDIATSAGSGNGVASFLLGQVQNVYGTNSLVHVRNLGQYGAIYVQDEFKYNQDLNLSLGLRYDVDIPFKEEHNFGSNFSSGILNTGVAGTGTNGALVFSGNGAGRDGLSSRWLNIYYKNIEPRLGLTWAPSFLNHKTVFSTSYNILSAPLLEWQQIYSGVPTGYSLTGQLNNTANPFAAAELLDPSSPASPGVISPGLYGVPPVGSAINTDRSQLNNQSIPWNKRSFGRPGFDQTWSATVQQELAPDLIFKLGYLGLRGTHLASNLLFANDISPSNFGFGAHLNDASTSHGILSYRNFSGTLAQALRPYPQYTTLNTAAYGENQGQLSYNAMVASLERRFHNGLNLQASYTWSKMLTDTGNIEGGSLGASYTSRIQNPFNLRAEKAVSPEDTPQIFVVSYLYDLPFGQDRTFLSHSHGLNYLVGGWTVTGIQRYQSGQPLSFGCATAIPAFDNCIRWNLLPGQGIQSQARKSRSSFNPAINNWYNRAAFQDPNANVTVASGLPYSFGNKPAYQSNDRSFPYYEEDFGLIKRTPLTENVDLQFRAESFNAFNRHVFGNSGSNPYDVGFGTVSSTNNSPRAIQLTLRLEF